MFARFNLELHDDLISDDYRKYGLGQKLINDELVHKALDNYLLNDGYLDASAMEEDWFPEIKANVFLSHSHADEKAVIRLAGYLFQEYGITSFIDSTVWGYANDLLKKIDDQYCVQSTKPDGGHTYDYDKRNQSTAHVHMILQGALAKMINRCECLIFVNTPKSLVTTNIGDSAVTASPWIYSELLMANTFPAREPEYYNIMLSERTDSIMEYSELKVKYKVGLTDFIDIDLDDFKSAAKRVTRKGARALLDRIYLNKGLMVSNTITG